MKGREPVTLTTGFFLTIVAKAIVAGYYSGNTNHWPENNYWQVVSSVRLNILKEEIPNLMLMYGVDTLTDYDKYFGEIPQENSNAKSYV